MDDKKKIVFLSIAVVVAIVLIVLIMLARRGSETTPVLPSLPSAPPFTTPGGITGEAPGGTVTPTQPSWPTGSSGVVGPVAPGAGATGLNAFLPKWQQSAVTGGGFYYNAAGVYVAPDTPQPKSYVPLPLSISTQDVLAQIPSGTIYDMASDMFGSSTISTMVQNQLGLANTTSASDVIASLQSLQSAVSAMNMNQNFGAATTFSSQDMNLLNSVLLNPSGTISNSDIINLIQRMVASSSLMCQQFAQAFNNLPSSTAAMLPQMPQQCGFVVGQ